MSVTKEGLLAIGAVLTGAAVALWAAFWVYCLENSGARLNSWPSWTCAAIGALGLCLLLVGSVGKGAHSGFQMKQQGGDNSFNVQAGRNAVVTDDSPNQDD